MWISERESDISTGCGTYPHVPDEARMNNHQASYLVSIHLIFVLIDQISLSAGWSAVLEFLELFLNCS